jgi:hypothetical protein
MNILISTVGVALEAFIAASPAQAARIWGSEKFDELAPAQKPMFLRWFRALGILVCVASILFAIDSMAFSHYHH